jgi:hypothetical protein
MTSRLRSALFAFIVCSRAWVPRPRLSSHCARVRKRWYAPVRKITSCRAAIGEEEDAPGELSAVGEGARSGEDCSRGDWSCADIEGSEWKMAIQWFDDDGNPKGNESPQETWVRFKKDFEAEWGVGARGLWSLDGEFLSVSRDFVLGWGGKRIFSCKLSRKQNEAFLEGMVSSCCVCPSLRPPRSP